MGEREQDTVFNLSQICLAVNFVEYFAREGSYQEGHKVVNDALETIRRIGPVPSIASA